MTTRRDILTAFAPAYRARAPHRPTAHRQVISAIQQCPSGHDGPSLSQCSSCGGHHRVQHAWGNRHGPQCQPHTTPQWLAHHLGKPLPGPHGLLTCTVPAALSPFLRSHQRLASHARFHASSAALKRLAKDERFIGTARPGVTDVLHTWGRQRQYHPPIPSMVPGGGLAEDRTTWRPSSATFFGPVKALSPISRALFKEARHHAGLLEHSAPPGWAMPWQVRSRAHHNGPSAFTYLAP